MSLQNYNPDNLRRAGFSPFAPPVGPVIQAVNRVATVANQTNAQAPVSDNFSYWRSVFQSYGLGNVWDEVVKGLEGKTGADDYSMVLERVRQSPTYKKKFSGMAERVNQGYSAITEAQYLEARDAYTKSLRTFGIDIKDVFTDSKGKRLDEDTAFGVLIGRDVSPSEFQERLRVAEQWTKSVEPGTREALKKFYGLEGKDLMAYALNPTGGQAVLQRKAAAVRVGAEAAQAGFNLVGAVRAGTTLADEAITASYIEGLATRGLGSDSSAAEFQRQAEVASEAVARAGTERSAIEQLAAISGEDITAEEQVEAQYGSMTGLTSQSDRKAVGKVKRLASQERARFGGSSAGRNIFAEDMSDF
jgi:hypothetical protein